MSKKNKNYNKELTVDDRFDLMFGNNETEDETSEKDWFHNKRDFAEQIAKSFGVSNSDDVEEPTSILKPSSIDDLNEDTESNDTAEDVITMLGIKSNNGKKAEKSEEKSETKLTDTRKAKIVTRETSRVEQVSTADRAETPRIELWFDEKTHVLHFSDGVRCLDMPLDIMNNDEKVTTNGIPSEEDFERLYEKLVVSSVPVAVLSEVAFRMQYLYTYTFYKAMPFRFMYIDRGNHKIVYAYVLDPNYQYNLMTTYTSLKETNRLSSAYRLLSLFTDVDVIFSRRMFAEHGDWVSDLRNELAIYGRCEEMLVSALKSDPVASSEPSEIDMKHIDELDGSVFIHEDAGDLYRDQIMGDSVLLNITVPETILYNNENGDDGDDEETETPSWRESDDDEDEFDSSNEDAEEEDIPILAPKDEEERRSIMEAFGQPSDDDDEDDEEDSDDSDEEEDEEDIAKFLKDDDDKDDGDDFIIDVKR